MGNDIELRIFSGDYSQEIKVAYIDKIGDGELRMIEQVVELHEQIHVLG